MIPILTPDIEYIKNHWDSPEDQNFIIERCAPVSLGEDDTIPVHAFHWPLFFPDLYKEFKDLVPIGDFWEYGYCDTEESLKKYLKPYIENSSENYMVFVGFMDMDYEKYYRNGSYINKDGIDTGDDYFDYIEEHPDMEIEQDYPEQWITFSIRKIASEV